MTGLRDFHASVFDFATKVMTVVEGQRGGCDRSCQITATITFAGDGVNRKFTISHVTGQNTSHRRCVVVREHRDSSEKLEDLEDLVGVGGRGPPSSDLLAWGQLHSTYYWIKDNSK